MCIVIDTNTLTRVFVPTSEDHHEFKPVFDWIMEGKGKGVYGGTKYINEIGRFKKLFIRLRDAKKAIYIKNNKVDQQETLAAAKIEHPDFDDQHLVGLLIESGCKLICSKDDRAYPFFTHSSFFTPANRPKIYSSKRNKNLLSDRNIANICAPSSNTTHAQREQLKGLASFFSEK